MSQLRVWHIQNVPNSPQFNEVKTVGEAVRMIRALAGIDLKNSSIISNVFGLEVFDEDIKDWIEWEDDEGRDISAYEKEVYIP